MNVITAVRMLGVGMIIAVMFIGVVVMCVMATRMSSRHLIAAIEHV